MSHLLKDFLTSKVIKSYLNHKIKHYGHMTSFHIDTESKTIRITVDLAGETTPVEATIRYAVEADAAGMSFIPVEVSPRENCSNRRA